MAKIEGSKEVQAKLQKLAAIAKRENRDSVIVGYTSNYALHIHENLEMKWKGKERTGKRADDSKRKGKYWDPQGKGQSQYLVQPFREMNKQLTFIIHRVYKATKSVTQGLLLAGFQLQRESQKRVPVDSGNLKGSAFTRVEKR